MKPEKEVRLEYTLKRDFIDEVYSIPGGEQIKRCIQCGTCSGSCPTSYLMDYTPRQIFAMVRAGMRKEVLESEAILYCCSCYMCQVRCPQNIKITDVFYALKRIAWNETGLEAPEARLYKMSPIFFDIVRKKGRNHEIELMTKFSLAAAPMEIFKQAPIGVKLFFKGRLPLAGKKIKGLKELQKMLDYCEKHEVLGGIVG